MKAGSELRCRAWKTRYEFKNSLLMAGKKIIARFIVVFS